MRPELLHRRAFRLIHTFEEGSFARDAAACMVDIAVVDIAVDIAAGIVADIVADIAVDIAVDIGVAIAGASLAAVLPFVDKAEPFA